MVQTYEKPSIRPVFALINVIAASDEGRKEGANQRRSEWPTLIRCLRSPAGFHSTLVTLYQAQKPWQDEACTNGR
jgi:hypothetical protein